jgi:hypothetical protein
MTELAVHPVAALFPMLADDELEELAAGHQTPAPAWQDIKHLPLRDGLVGEIHMLTFIIITVLLFIGWKIFFPFIVGWFALRQDPVFTAESHLIRRLKEIGVDPQMIGAERIAEEARRCCALAITNLDDGTIDAAGLTHVVEQAAWRLWGEMRDEERRLNGTKKNGQSH